MTAGSAGDDLRGPGIPGPSSREGVLVGMSGGVDSSVAALLLKRQGYRVVGVTLKLYDDPTVIGERTCCSPEAVHRAKAVAHQLIIPHLTIDAREIFREQVVEYFVAGYGAGKTPNPCAKCNSRVRFQFMLEVAKRLGLKRLATGHYARMVGEPAALARGQDRAKDQSYVLAEVGPDLLRDVLFPLGELTKPQVRVLASEAGLVGASAPESQEICFVPDDDHVSFLTRRLGERSGKIVDSTGAEWGSHSGTYRFTIGQRKGVRIAHREALYVVALDSARNEVMVGPKEETAVGALRLEGVVHHRTRSGKALTVQVRSSGGVYLAEDADDGHIILQEPAFGVAPGQTAVLYEGDNVVLAGTIAKTERWTGSTTPASGAK
jgi:tRNA-specific 2-thiouridylase